jgi:two-component system, chemotaxis family, chemotaxis protein CheY
MRILLVDDSPTMRSIERNVLSALGKIEFVEAADGLEALVAIALSPERFDLVLIDWNMPNLNGYQLVGRIRQEDKVTPLIMVTTDSERPHVLSAIQAGANGYLIKPFKPDLLIERAKQAMAGSKDAA